MKKLKLRYSKFPVLHTARLSLREVTMKDKHEVFAMRSDKNLMRFIARPPARSLKEAEDHVKMIRKSIRKNEIFHWGITLKGEKKVIGMIGFYRMVPEHYRTEVGYIMMGEYHGKGIMDEALKAVLQFGFQKIGFHQIEGIIDPRNKASEKLLLKNKFVRAAYFKENYFYAGKFLDSANYCLLNPGE